MEAGGPQWVWRLTPGPLYTFRSHHVLAKQFGKEKSTQKETITTEFDCQFAF